MREGRTRIIVPAGGGTGTLYIPAEVIKDSSFPFQSNNKVNVRIRGRRLIIENRSPFAYHNISKKERRNISTNKKRILVVDDDKSILEGFKAIFEAEKYAVDVAATGLEAIKKVKEDFYDLALLDIRLQDIEGTDLLAEMNKSSPHMMKIMITGYPSVDNAIRSLNLGADGYIVKPVDPTKLLNTVKNKFYQQDSKIKSSIIVRTQ